MKNKIRSIVYSTTSGVLMLLPKLVFGADLPDRDKNAAIFNDVKDYDESQFTAGLARSSVMEIIVGILNWLLIAIGVLGVIGFIIAGILYLTAAGNDKQIEKAKGAMVACIIGVLVGLAGFVALRFAANLLNNNTF